MKFKFLKIVFTGVVLSLSCLVNFANAELIVDTNNDSFIDTRTGLEWMDFGVNNNLSFNYIAGQLGVGGMYEGWNIGNYAQVHALWGNAFLGIGAETELVDVFPHRPIWVTDGFGKEGSVFTQYLDVMGVNEGGLNGEQNVHYADGMFQQGSAVGVAYYSVYYGSSDLTNLDSAGITGGACCGSGGSARSRSTMLYREAIGNVPEPPTLAIFALGIIGLGLRRIK